MMGWYFYSWDLSWIVTTVFGAKTSAVKAWSEPLMEAFLQGAWYLFWTDETLYWIAKPTLHLTPDRRLHCPSGPCVENDVENLYFLEGNLVDEQIVMHPETQTLEQLHAETNEEIRRIRIDRFGWERFLQEDGAKVLHHRRNDRDAQDEILVESSLKTRHLIVTDPSTARRYVLGVPRIIKQCQEAQNFLSHGLDGLCVHRS